MSGKPYILGIKPKMLEQFIRRAGLALRPFGGGFFLSGAYSGLTLEGSISGVELASAVPARRRQTPEEGPGLALKTTLHMLHAQTGYEWLWGNMVVRAIAGGAITLDADSDVMLQDAQGNRVDLGLLDDPIEAYLDEAFMKYAHTPTFGLQLGYRFF